MAATDRQVRALFRLLLGDKTLEAAALRTDMDEKTARKYRRLKQLPSELVKPHTWATRRDPFGDVWSEVQSLLEEHPRFQGKTIFGELRRRYPGRFTDGQLRTLQRKVRRWRALSGPPKEVYFAQVHEPGRLGASDFTHMDSLNVTIEGQPFAHLVYHFVLTYSNWEAATICFSESFESLSEGMQNALWELGGAPARHRTDRLSTAVNNLSERKEFTRRYQGLLGHYGMAGEKIQAGHGNENGDVEQRHYRFKGAVDQELMLRGHRDFASRADYEQFLRRLLDQLNAGRRDRLTEELRVLRPLPARRLEAYRRERVRVDGGSLIHVERNTYTVPSRLIGESVDVRLYAEHLEVWYAQQLMERQPRLRGRDKHQGNYRHVIDWLVRKPGAFAQYRYGQDLFPSSVFRLAYDALMAQDAATADKEYLRILYTAARENESAVASALRQLLATGQPIAAAMIEAMVTCATAPAVPEVTIESVDLSQFDDLLTDEEDDHAFGGEGKTGDDVAGTAPAEFPRQLRGSGSASRAGDVQLRAIPAGVVRTGRPGPADQADQPAVGSVRPSAGEELGGLRPQAVAREAGPTSAELAGWEFRGPPGEPAGLRQSRLGENASAVRVGPGTGPSGPAGVLHDVRSAGTGVVGRQTRPQTQRRAETVGAVRGDSDRRPGICATEPGGDGSPVYTLGGTVRTRQRLADEQPAVLEMGSHLQGSDDDGGGHRPARAPQRDSGTESAQLPAGRGQKSEGEIAMTDRFDEEPPAGSGSATHFAATRQSAPLRQTPPVRRELAPWATRPRTQERPHSGIPIVAGGEM